VSLASDLKRAIATVRKAEQELDPATGRSALKRCGQAIHARTRLAK